MREMMRVSRGHVTRFGALAVAAVSAVALVGCTSTIDNGKLQDKIKSDLVASGATNVSVSCPSGVEAKQGKSFTCTAKCTLPSGQSSSGTVSVEQTSNNGDVRFSGGCNPSGAGAASTSASA